MTEAPTRARRPGPGVSIRAKLILMVAGTLVLAITLAAILIRDLVYQNIVNNKIKTVDILTASLVHDIKYDFQPDNNDVVSVIIDKYMTYYRIIRGISFYNPQRVNIADSQPKRVGQNAADPLVIGALTEAKPSVTITSSDWTGFGIRSVAPILHGSRIVGAVAMDISIQDIHTTLAAIDRRILMILVVTVFAASALLYAMLRSSILIRLTRLVGVTREIAAGNYDIRVADSRRDEIGGLAQAFDQMTAELRKSKHELDEYNQHLEQRVREQTAKLQEAYEDLKNAQTQLVLKEKMASLGVLIAGIAHEINTPIGAIHNVARNLQTKLASLPAALQHFKDDPTVSAADFCAFLAELVAMGNRIEQSATHEEMRAIEGVLRAEGVESFRETAGMLAKLKFTDVGRIRAAAPFLKQRGVVTLAESFASIAQGIKISETSSQKIAEIVRALKYYAYTDKGVFERIQINQSIQTALVLFRNRLKHSVEIDTHFADDLPDIPCTSELHQVWTNLLGNACDAIEAAGEGTNGRIGITTAQEGDHILVRVADNGAGIPSNILDKIFDPFFTTKDIGKGTGLGLSIVSGIIQKHHGAIEVASCPGRTIFAIRLPIKQDVSIGDPGKDEKPVSIPNRREAA